jgi:two-component system CheB/CheR fusion protein
LQKKLIPLFHYALKPGGMLFMGTSETVGEFGNLFAVLDRKSKVYQRKEDSHAVLGRFLPAMTAIEVTQTARKAASAGRLPLRELTEQVLLQQVAPAGALVNGQGDILYLHGRTGAYLEPAPGEAGINNILKMARDGLRRELTTALHKAVGTREIVPHPGLRVKTNGDFTTVNLTVRPLAKGLAATSEEPLYLIILEEATPSAPQHVQQEAAAMHDGKGVDGHDTSIPVGSEPGAGTETDATVAALKQELRTKEEYLQTANEELETSNEELKSSNEEMQSVNEELLSTNEEMETSKEELQSVNEELATVNSELQTKLADLSRANNDMNNLLAGTGVGTVFVDHQQRILRFTPATTRIVNLILTDVGRPIGHIVSNLVGYNNLVADVKAVLDTLLSKEVEVEITEGKSYLMRIMPYRTLENVIEGAVITFVEITEMKKTREALREAEWKFRALFEKGPIGVAYHEMVYDASGNPVDYRFLDANERYSELTGVDPRGKTVTQAFPGIENDPFDWIGTFGHVARTGEQIRFEQYLQPNGRWYDCVAYQYKPDHFVAAFLEITERKRAEESLGKANEELRLAANR